LRLLVDAVRLAAKAMQRGERVLAGAFSAAILLIVVAQIVAVYEFGGWSAGPLLTRELLDCLRSEPSRDRMRSGLHRDSQHQLALRRWARVESAGQGPIQGLAMARDARIRPVRDCRGAVRW
jgi:hypothetical protein